MNKYRIAYEPEKPIPDDGWDTAIESLTMQSIGKNMMESISLANETVERMGLHMIPATAYVMVTDIPVEKVGDDDGRT